jgi:hypothetical protein
MRAFPRVIGTGPVRGADRRPADIVGLPDRLCLEYRA